ncbi:MAG TPA: cellulase family glycosylhydrolase, partial [Dehalococcoidia bacterium]
MPPPAERTTRPAAVLKARVLFGVMVATAILGMFAGVTAAPTNASAAQLSISVSGNHLVDGSSKTIRLLGVNRSGTEYACIQGWGIFDGPSDFASVAAIASWHVNAVRVPLNEDCWLNINMGTSTEGGTVYQQAIMNYVNTLNQSGIYAILDLHWTAAGTNRATYQQPMPDADHAPAFWSSVAATFKNNPGVIFDLFNEPFWNPWSCWLSGCTVWGGTPGAYQSAGMQSLVTAVRGSGATQPIMLGGLAYANDLSGWLANLPNDPLHQLIASVHIYNFNTCSTITCFSSGANSLAPIAAAHPVVIGEVGENDCAHGFIDNIMPWADSSGYSYLGWAWNTAGCTSFPALITNYDGTPTGFGIGFRDHLAALTSIGWTPKTTVSISGTSFQINGTTTSPNGLLLNSRMVQG